MDRALDLPVVEPCASTGAVSVEAGSSGCWRWGLLPLLLFPERAAFRVGEFIRQKLPKYGLEKGLPSLDDAQVRVNVLAALGADGWELVCVRDKSGEDNASGKWSLTSWYMQRRAR